MKKLLTPDEFRAALGGNLGRQAIYQLLTSGSIRHIRVGRKFLIPRSEVEEWPDRAAGGSEDADDNG